jgi:hypothetical protein
MKKRLTLTILFVPFIVMAQKPFNRSTFEIIDKYEMSVKRIGGTLENFAMSLVRRIDQTEKDTVIGVNIELQSTKKSDLITSSGFTITSNLDFAIGSSTVRKVENKEGSMLLSAEEFLRLIDFFNETIAIKNTLPLHDTGWQLVVENRFTLIFLYESKALYKWKYYMSLDDAEFELNYESAIEMFKKMRTFRDLMGKGL